MQLCHLSDKFLFTISDPHSNRCCVISRLMAGTSGTAGQVRRPVWLLLATSWCRVGVGNMRCVLRYEHVWQAHHPREAIMQETDLTNI